MANDAVKKGKGADLSGLDSFSVSSLIGGGKKGQGSTSHEAEAGSVSYAPLDRFYEDPDNARLEFDLEKLQELADSMEQVNPSTGKPRGILEPLSVKHHPEKPGHFIINGGNRRFRAAGLASLEEVPYIIKDELDDFDKFVLNDQRENLSPLEIATFIKARLGDGHKAGEVAKALGRPPSYVSDHKIFFDMADCIRDLYDSSLCRSMQALALLHRAYKKHQASIEGFCVQAMVDGQELATSRVRTFIDALKEPKKAPEVQQSAPEASGGDLDGEGDASESDTLPIYPQAESGDAGDGDGAGKAGQDTTEHAARDKEQQALMIDGEPLSGGSLDSQADHFLDEEGKGDRIKKAIIQVRHDERVARLLTDRRAAYGMAWLKYDDDGHEFEADLNQVQLVAVIEG